MAEQVRRIDVTTLTDEDLLQIQNDVLRALANRARPGGMTPGLMYDRHGSGHSKNSSAMLTVQTELPR